MLSTPAGTGLFPVFHSVLDASALAREVATRYELSGPVHGVLMHRGMNDVYMVRIGGTRYAVRAWRANWRTFDNVTYETDFLDFLDQRGLPVAPPLRGPDGSLWFRLETAEGSHPVAVFRWADGIAFGDRATPEQAVELGGLFGRMHLEAAGFRPSVERLTNPVTDLADNLPTLLALVGDSPDRDIFEMAVERVTAAVRAIDRTRIPRGPNHGDFHFNNAYLTEDGRITLLDFDNAGDDYFIQDIACYAWANEYAGRDPAFVDRFIEGYDAVRPLSADERNVMPLLVTAKELRLITGFSRHVNAVGFFPLRFRSLEWFAGSLLGHMEQAGLA